MASLEVITELPRLARRAADSNKGSYGKVLVMAGSRGMSGAAVLCGSGALRGGAGLVYVAVPEEILVTVAAANPCYLTAPLPQDEHGQLAARAESRVLALSQGKTVVAVGPGLGQGRGITSLVVAILGGLPLPLALDGDRLDAVGAH